MYDIKILLVEDDGKLRKIISKYLASENFHVVEAPTGEDAFAYLDYENFHLAILDVMLPDMESWSILKKIKTHHPMPVIMLTARGLEEDKLHGFDLGADDYVTKPFSAKELMARVKIQLRHFMPSQRDEIVMGALVVEKGLRQVVLKGKEICLTALEYNLLMVFIDHDKLVLSRQQLLDKVWGMDYFGDARTVDTHVKRLRQKLEDDGNFIQTVRGLGYKWEVL